MRLSKEEGELYGCTVDKRKTYLNVQEILEVCPDIVQTLIEGKHVCGHEQDCKHNKKWSRLISK